MSTVTANRISSSLTSTYLLETSIILADIVCRSLPKLYNDNIKVRGGPAYQKLIVAVNRNSSSLTSTYLSDFSIIRVAMICRSLPEPYNDDLKVRRDPAYWTLLVAMSSLTFDNITPR